MEANPTASRPSGSAAGECSLDELERRVAVHGAAGCARPDVRLRRGAGCVSSVDSRPSPIVFDDRRVLPDALPGRWCEPERSETNDHPPMAAYRPFCDDNVLVLVALTS